MEIAMLLAPAIKTEPGLLVWILDRVVTFRENLNLALELRDLDPVSARRLLEQRGVLRRSNR